MINNGNGNVRANIEMNAPGHCDYGLKMLIPDVSNTTFLIQEIIYNHILAIIAVMIETK